MLTQIELEHQMYDHGRSRAERMMNTNEEGGRANANPYAQAVYRRFVLPLAAIVQEDMDSRFPGRRKAHTALLEGLDSEAVAYLAVRNLLNIMMTEKEPPVARTVSSVIGKAVFHEKCLALFSEASPELFYTLVNDLDRRLSKSERHRMTVFKMQARESGVPVPEWGQGDVIQVGAYLVDQLEKLGMVETRHATVAAARTKALRTSIHIRLAEPMTELISGIKDHIIGTTPYYLPCVEQPKDWVSLSDGGFHTKQMRRMQPFAVRSVNLRSTEDFTTGDMTIPLAAINSLQSTAWQVNGKMLDAIRDVARHFDMEEILSQAEFPAPFKPDWLMGDMKTEDMTPPQQEQFIHWKRQKAEWFTQMKLRGTKYGRFYTATTVAEKFREFPAIYFVYFADFRGRLYAQTTGVSPQGSDMQKALLRFAVGKGLETLDAEKWFCIHGANKWGYDKVSLDARVDWVKEHHDQIMGFASDHISNNDWRDADSPLQFLAWCFEYAEWKTSPHTFVSHIPVGMDGTCNGLQNFSAMLRDELGGKATNLVPGDKPNDIYQMVADVTALAMRQAEPDEAGYRDKWLAHGLNRKLVKRSVMTLPYGSTRFSSVDFIVGDYLKMGQAPEFEKAEYSKAAQYLSFFVWDAIGEVVVKAREAMTWLQKGAKEIIKEGHETVKWTSPSGFPVIQAYNEKSEHQIRTNLCGKAILKIHKDTQNPDANRHRNGVAPNFIHSYDAAHLHLVAVAAKLEGFELAMIHDDYGTHAADSARFYNIIRECFVAMYERADPLAEFAEQYALSSPPSKGGLNLRDVLRSPYFFS